MRGGLVRRRALFAAMALSCSGCVTFSGFTIGAAYADHPPWRRGGIGDRLEGRVELHFDVVPAAPAPCLHHHHEDRPDAE